MSDNISIKQLSKAGQDFYPRTNVAAIVDFPEMGASGGVATLDENGKVPSQQLPSFVDDVLEYNNLNTFPRPGEAGKIYVAKDTNKTYRWGGSDYVEISETIAIGTTTGTAYPGEAGAQLASRVSTLENTAFSGDYDDLINKPTIPVVPTNVSAFTNDAGYLTEHQDISGKVDKIEGKGLSTNDYTSEEKNKLASITSGAEANVQSNWNETDSSSDAYIQNKPDLSDLTTIRSGAAAGATAYQKPSTGIPASDLASGIILTDVVRYSAQTLTSEQQAQVRSNIGVENSFSGDYNDLANKPTIPNTTSQLTNDSGFITISDIPEGAAASTSTPLMDGTAAVGTELAFARGDHRHPSDTSKQDVISDLATIRSGAALGATALQSFIETDPIFSASPAAGITSEQISSWDDKAAESTANMVSTSSTLTADTIILGNGSKAVKSSSYTISDTLSSSSTVIPTGKAVSDKFAELSGALKLLGVSTTAVTDGGTENPTIDGDAVTTKTTGDVVIYGEKEFVWTGSAWEQLGDEGSYALKTTTITAGSGLTGGGALSSNVTIGHSNTVAAQSTQALYPISIDAQGHISGYGTAVTPLTAASTLDASKLSGTIPSTVVISGKEDTSNKVTSISSSSTNTEYPSALAVYNAIATMTQAEVNTTINTIFN